MIEHALHHLETLVLPTNDSDPHVQYCIEEAQIHLTKAREFLASALIDPKKQYEESLEFYKMMFQILPMVTILQSYEPPLLGQETVDNLSDTQSSIPSTEDNYEPVTPPRR